MSTTKEQTEAPMSQPSIQESINAIARPLAILKKTQKNDGEINWVTAIFMGLFHLGAIAALFFFSWGAFFVAAFLWWVATSLGIGMCYHRLLTHRGYKAPRWLEYLLTVFATLALEGGPIFWVATHRIHHKYSDHEGDPHSPVDGTWWSHMGWILTGKSMHHDTTTLARYVPDLAKDKFYVWITKYHYVPMIVLGVVLLALGGLPFVLWGIFLRTVVGLHFTWLVNSATHSIGTRRFQTRDLSTNSWWVALVTWGEGWHNNHHAHPVSARHGLTWYEIDFNWYCIWALKKIGLITKVHTAKISEMKRENESIIGRTLTPEIQRELASVEL
jgi:sn-1 stearoyl-lipid 9-desaturase